MATDQVSLPRIDSEPDPLTCRCGCCRHVAPYEFTIKREDWRRIQAAALEISKMDVGRTQPLILILAALEKIQREPCFCRQGRTWVHLLGEPCKLWKPLKIRRRRGECETKKNLLSTFQAPAQ